MTPDPRFTGRETEVLGGVDEMSQSCAPGPWQRGAGNWAQWATSLSSASALFLLLPGPHSRQTLTPDRIRETQLPPSTAAGRPPGRPTAGAERRKGGQGRFQGSPPQGAGSRGSDSGAADPAKQQREWLEGLISKPRSKELSRLSSEQRMEGYPEPPTGR